MFHVFLIFVWILHNEWSVALPEIPEIVYEMCPYSTICNRTASLTLQNDTLVPCCKSCGCDDDCGLRFDCCFDHLDNYKLIKKNKAACIGEGVFEERHYMITSCNLKPTNDDLITMPCNLSDSNGKSIVEPVSSRTTGYIYVNTNCAKCNGVEEYTKWNYVLILDAKATGTVTWSLEQTLGNAIVRKAYVSPSDEDWSSMECYYTEPTKGLCQQKPEYQPLCDDLFAVFQVENGYQLNVICLMCRGTTTFPKECSSKEFRGVREASFMVLVDINVLTESETLLHQSTQDKPATNTCPGSLIEYNGSYLEILCRDGMLRTVRGCQYFSRRWFAPFYIVMMKLMPTTNRRLPVEGLRNLGSLERNNPLLWILNPCLKVNPSSLILYNDEQANDNTIFVNSLVIALWKDTLFGFEPELEYPFLRKCFEQFWYLNVKNVTYEFTSVLVRKDIVPLSVKYKPVNVQTFAEGPRFFTYDRPDRGIQVTKTFFCEQVRIPYNDGIHLSSGELFIISKNKTLGMDKYTENKNRYANETTFSVCLEDLDIECRSRTGLTSHSREKLLDIFLLVLLLSV